MQTTLKDLAKGDKFYFFEGDDPNSKTEPTLHVVIDAGNLNSIVRAAHSELTFCPQNTVWSSTPVEKAIA